MNTLSAWPLEESVDVAARYVASCGLTHFAIAFHQSGLGDQFLTAMVTSKICDMIGLKYSGVVAETVAYRNRIDDLFDHGSEDGWFHETFGRALSMVPVSECARHIVCGKTPDNLIRSLVQLARKESRPSILALNISAQDAGSNISGLEDRRGNCLENSFYRACQEHLPVENKRSDGKKRMLIHLRLGDFVPLSALRKGYVVLAVQSAIDKVNFEIVTNDAYARHPRNPGLDYCLGIAQRIKEKSGDGVEFCFISDGVERPINLLTREVVKASLREHFGLADVEAYTQELSTSYRNKFEALTGLGEAVIGEGRQQFRQSLALLRSADVTITTSGSFAIAVENCASRESKKQSIFQLRRNIVWPTRANLDINYLRGNFDEDLTEIGRHL